MAVKSLISLVITKFFGSKILRRSVLRSLVLFLKTNTFRQESRAWNVPGLQSKNDFLTANSYFSESCYFDVICVSKFQQKTKGKKSRNNHSIQMVPMKSPLREQHLDTEERYRLACVLLRKFSSWIFFKGSFYVYQIYEIRKIFLISLSSISKNMIVIFPKKCTMKAFYARMRKIWT